MTARMVLLVGCGLLAAIGATGLGFYLNAAPACDSTKTLGAVYQTLRSDFHLDSVFLNDVVTVSGGLFSESRDCIADITPIRGNENASASQWRELRYHVAHADKSQPIAITVQLGGDVPLAAPQLSLWKRLLAHL